MFYSVRGKLIHKEQSMAVVECGGVGYKCMTTLSTLAKLPATGQEVFLYTHLNVREDAVDLFGFADKAELASFKLLTSVSGVGPKVALSLLSDIPPDRFAVCVMSGDAKSLTAAQGVGPKLAQRIILELKDKVSTTDLSATGMDASFGQLSAVPSSNTGEAISALVVLGYSQSEAAVAVAKLNSSLSVEELIMAALKTFGSRR